MTLTEMNNRFALPRQLIFKEGNGTLPIAEISNAFASAAISLYGAHVLRFQPKGQQDFLWLSKKSSFEIGKPIRGGIPLCFPWFGPHTSDPKKPVHGFARLVMWDVVKTASLPDGATQLVLGLHENETTKAILPITFSVELSVTVGKTLEVALTATNTGSEPFTISDALHTYFNISDLSNITIDGLGNASYYDGPTSSATQQQAEALLAITKEENRRYIDTTNDCLIRDKGFGRTIRAVKRGSNVTVVWNPWAESSKAIGDMHEGGYKTFICVEAVNAYNDVITLAPSASHTLAVILSAE
ncbi:MAG TPA: D-hexose-6-phosphate mutarotase [Bacteroidota bacterium]|nr:D-hexose-6-phosphate mutarotase [Bacteroidota bacterium]